MIQDMFKNITKLNVFSPFCFPLFYSKMARDGQEEPQYGPKMATKWPPDGPPMAPNGPQMAQDGPRWPPNGPQMAHDGIGAGLTSHGPGGIRVALTIVFKRNSMAREFPGGGLGNDFEHIPLAGGGLDVS